MMRRTTFLSRVLILAAAAATVSLGGSHPKGDLVETAVAAGSFETLVGAVKAAGLLETLRGPGPYTVFAPTDEAFAKIPRATLRGLLEPRNRATLTKILTYHVVPGRLAAADVVALNGAKTVEGGLVKFASNGRDVHVNNARVLKANVETTNGIIHVIDTVLMP
ncbi:MAG: fasciclin domain-containing protein [Acidobacteria bacterium]|nr:fasciclin domain-containing protein [Acidobacteriota bacterium]